MAVTAWPFDGQTNTEAQWVQWAVASGITSGVTSGFSVAASSGMVLTVSDGFAVVQGLAVQGTSIPNLTIATAHATNPRKDYVVIRVDWTNNSASVAVVTGTPASSPSLPPLQQTSLMWEHPIAVVSVAAGAANINSGNISSVDPGSPLGLVAYSSVSVRPVNPGVSRCLGINTGTKTMDIWQNGSWSSLSIDSTTVGGRSIYDGDSSPSAGTGVNNDLYFEW